MEKERIVRPERYAIYKGMGGKNGAVQFNYIPWDPNRVRDGKPSPEGFVLIEASRAIDKNIYDWDNKVTFALSVDDIGKFLVLVRSGGEIFHENKGTNKKLKLQPGNEDKNGNATWMFGLEAGSGEARQTVSLPISESEMNVIRSLLTKAISGALGWF